MSRVGGRRIGTATTREDSPLYIPRGGVYGGGKYGERISDVNRTFAILREPVPHRVVCTVAKDIFDNWFTLELEDAKQQENKQFDKLIQAELQRLRAKRECTIMSVMERGYGYSIIVLGFQDEGKTLEEPLKNPTRLRQIKAYGKPQITSVKVDKNETDKDGKPNPRFGLPEIYNIEVKGRARRLRVHHSRVIHFATRYYDPTKAQWEGQSVLDDIWDDVVVLRNIRWSMGQTMFRYGSGFPVFTFNEATKAQLQAWVDAGLFGDVSNRTYFVKNEKQDIKFEGIAGRALDPMNYYVPPMEHISAGTGIPLAILRGVQAGALTGSEVNQMEYYSIISDEQSAYESGLRKLIDIIRLFAVKKDEEAVKKMGAAKITEAITAIAHSDMFIGLDAVEIPKETEMPNFTFNWKGGFELDEEKKARIELLNAQTLQIRGRWLKINEIRKIENPDDQGIGAEGERLLSQSAEAPEQPGFEPPLQVTHGDSTFLVSEVPRHRGPQKKSAAEDWCAQKGGEWVTIKGNHICILPGETPKEAFERQTGKTFGEEPKAPEKPKAPELEEREEESVTESIPLKTTIRGKERELTLKHAPSDKEFASVLEKEFHSYPEAARGHISGFWVNTSYQPQMIDILDESQYDEFREFLKDDVGAYYNAMSGEIVVHQKEINVVHHEVGHAFFRGLTDKQRDAWTKAVSKETKMPSGYAHVDDEEAFAECFMYSRYKPEEFKKKHPAKAKCMEEVSQS